MAETESNNAMYDNSPRKLDFEIADWGFVHGRVDSTRRIIAWVIVVGGGLILALTIFAMYRLGGDNFGTVTEGKVYRSAMPSGKEVKAKINRHNIKTVLRLVGIKDQNTESYEEESAAIAETDAKLLIASLPTSRKPYRSELQTLFSHLDSIKKDGLPVLIHCQQGSDRTGLVSVIWLRDYENIPFQQAREQMDFWPHMHVGGDSIDDFLDEFEKFSGNDPTITIQYWVKTNYFNSKDGQELVNWNDGKMYYGHVGKDGPPAMK